MTRYSSLVVADDLTGANDTGQQFATAGLDTVVIPSHSTRRPDADVLVVDTDTRTSDSQSATATVRDAISTVSATQTYKKVDSTLRGNVSAEIDAALSAVPSSLALVAPAFPATGRITVGGYHLVDGIPVSEAPAVQERENPPAESTLTALFAESEYPTAHVSIETVASGSTAVAARLCEIQQAQNTVVSFDAATDTHLHTIVDAGRRLEETPLYVGSAGLAAAFGQRVSAPTSTTTSSNVTEVANANRILGIVGSTNQRTFDQLRRIPDEFIVTLDIERAIDDPTGAGTVLASAARDRLHSDEIAVITSAVSNADVTAALDHGKTHGIGSESVRITILTALITAVSSLWTDYPPDAVFASGGTVAGAVFETLEIDAIELGTESIERTVPLTTATARGGRQIALATKAGGFGSDNAIVNCLAALGAKMTALKESDTDNNDSSDDDNR